MSAERDAARLRRMAELRALYERHVERFRAADAGDPLQLAREAHAEMEALLEQDRRLPGAAAVRCARGCSHCCRGPVEIRPHEAALLVEHLRDTGRVLDTDKLERQGAFSVDTWREQPASDQACVFLDDEGACSVYALRPNACRKLLVTSDPQHCDISRGEYERIERRFCWEAEMLESAALEVFGLELMPRALKAALDAGR
jgi:Fe-S-cluster containining protein